MKFTTDLADKIAAMPAAEKGVLASGMPVKAIGKDKNGVPYFPVPAGVPHSPQVVGVYEDGEPVLDDDWTPDYDPSDVGPGR